MRIPIRATSALATLILVCCGPGEISNTVCDKNGKCTYSPSKQCESGVVCGDGNCSPCAVGDTCTKGSDCVTATCSNGVCAETAPTTATTAGSVETAPTKAANTGSAPQNGGSYNDAVLADQPVAFWDVNHTNGTEPDLTGNGNSGAYQGGTPATTTMPNGDQVADFNGSCEYLTIPSNASLSIPTTGNLTWEGWIRPDVLQYPHSTGGYIDWMGKCASYSPTCEWEARMYNTSNSQDRYNRLSAYVFNPSAGLGSAADWQPTEGLLQAGEWYYVVGEYTTLSQPSDCPSTSAYPGSINIWVNGVKWSQSNHNPTGCMSQYSVVPVAKNTPVNIGTMAHDSWFQGAIGKVAIYNYLLSQTQITNHFQTMTGQLPSGSCANTCTLQ